MNFCNNRWLRIDRNAQLYITLWWAHNGSYGCRSQRKRISSKIWIGNTTRCDFRIKTCPIRLYSQSIVEDNQNTKIQHNIENWNMFNIDTTKTRGWTQILVTGKQFLPLIRHPPRYSYIIYIVKFDKSLESDRVKDQLSFEIWIFLNGQPDRNDDRKIVPMTAI